MRTSPTLGDNQQAHVDLEREINEATSAEAERVCLAYAVALQRAVVRLVSRTNPADADDIASEVVAAFYERTPSARLALMEQYSEPAQYARIVFRRSAYDYARNERIERCQGARLFKNDDGSQSPGRSHVPGDAPVVRGDDQAPSYFDLYGRDHGPAVEDIVVERGFAATIVDMALQGLSADERILFIRVSAGEEVKAIAAERGCARETLSRRISGIRARVSANVCRMRAAGMCDDLPWRDAGGENMP